MKKSRKKHYFSHLKEKSCKTVDISCNLSKLPNLQQQYPLYFFERRLEKILQTASHTIYRDLKNKIVVLKKKINFILYVCKILKALHAI